MLYPIHPLKLLPTLYLSATPTESLKSILFIVKVALKKTYPALIKVILPVEILQLVVILQWSDKSISQLDVKPGQVQVSAVSSAPNI